MNPTQAILVALLFLTGFLPQVFGAVLPECRGLYGIHDHDSNPGEYLNHIAPVAGCGWVTATVAVGHDVNDTGGADFSALANQGQTVICRINNGYFPNGTIPAVADYDAFARRCSNFVMNSTGCSLWVIGNELNIAGEWPVSGGRHAFVTPEQYADCFTRVYRAIKAIRPDHKVMPAALAPWSGPFGGGSLGGTPHDANPINWVQYMSRMLQAIESAGGVDGIALHINSRGYAPGDIHSSQRVNANGQSLSFSFYVYKDWIDFGIPSSLWHLPLYATECNGYYFWRGGHAEDPSEHYEPGWIQEIYAEINRHNQAAAAAGRPVFRCVNMYRWCGSCDGWNIDGANPYKAQILADLDAAVSQDYTWPASGGRIVLIPAGAAWRYHDQGANLGTVWRTPGYGAAAWAEGPAQLGYGDGDEATVIEGGPAGARHITSYFRHEFMVADTGAFTNLTLRLLRDDGAVVYLNGTEVFRSNMPGGAINHLTTATAAISGADEDAYFVTAIDTNLVQPGTNLLAVEVHQANPGSSDLSFDLELFGLGNAAPTVSLASPGEGAVLAGGGPIVLEAQAGDPDGFVARVVFIADETEIGEVTNAPFALLWHGAVEGAHILTAAAFDSGGLGVTSAPVNVVVQPGLILRGSTWKYHDQGVDLGGSWRTDGYVDTAWSEGAAQLGFGDGDEATVIDGGPAGSRHMTVYFLRHFTVDGAGAYTNLLLRLLRDDGAVVHLNGVELFRSNMPGGPVNFPTGALEAVGGGDEEIFYEVSLGATALRSGGNVLGVEVHQANPGSSDLSMDLELIGLRQAGRPELGIRRAGSVAVVHWPLDFGGYELETSGSPGGDAIWGRYQGTILTGSEAYAVLVPLLAEPQYFRLRKR